MRRPSLTPRIATSPVIAPSLSHVDHAIDKIILSREAIAARVAELGAQIAADLARLPSPERDDLVLVPVLTGSIVFVADLIRRLPRKLRMSVVSVSSYPGKSIVSQSAAIRSALPPHIEGRHVIVVDDIIDSGRTLSILRDCLLELKPASLKLCVLLRKDLPQARDFHVDYVGFDIPDEFVVGYGLDYDDYYRNLPDIVTLRKEVM